MSSDKNKYINEHLNSTDWCEPAPDHYEGDFKLLANKKRLSERGKYIDIRESEGNFELTIKDLPKGEKSAIENYKVVSWRQD